MTKRPLLGNILISRCIITQKELKEALRKHLRASIPLGQALIDLKYATEKDICEALSFQHDVPSVSLGNTEILKSLLDLMDHDTIKKYKAIPLKEEKQSLTLVICDIMNTMYSDELSFLLNKNIDFMLTTPTEWYKCLKKHFPNDTEEDIKITSSPDISMENLEKTIQTDTENTPIIDLVDHILRESIKNLASDIHLEAMPEGLKVRSRLDGSLIETLTVPPEISLAITSRIKIMANMDISETRLPQDGRILYPIDDVSIDLRVSVLPTIHGECIVIRVLDKRHVGLSLHDLGLNDSQEEKILKSLSSQGGLILTTGPTGSGKTTSIYALLKTLNTPEKKIMTIEDPIEYEIDGVIQSATHSKIDLTFAKYLRHLLRQDPDILMIGEMRDFETISVAIQSALTGHLVLSTLHTNNAIGSIVRLLDMKIEPFLISSTIKTIIAQRLLRVLCPYCKEEASSPSSILEKLPSQRLDLSLRKVFLPQGCEYCDFSGYRGRTGIFEILTMTPALNSLILEKAPEKDLQKQAQKDGMTLLREEGLKKVFHGVTSLSEVIEQTQESV
ncbi:hypothetical protein AB834_05790 [PVC group bacterium (ex Bugula neritina AB1)]|nr:hypothetical protein AB834_05790 [PVC group bacterium (ex Bugula neritina AB1)]